MLYRIRLNLAFQQEDPRRDIFDKVRDVFDQAITINPGQNNQEQGYLIIETCYHDEDPARPCEAILSWKTPVSP